MRGRRRRSCKSSSSLRSVGWEVAEAEEAAGNAMTVEAAANNDGTNYNCGF